MIRFVTKHSISLFVAVNLFVVVTGLAGQRSTALAVETPAIEVETAADPSSSPAGDASALPPTPTDLDTRTSAGTPSDSPASGLNVPASGPAAETVPERPDEPPPFDFAPYRVLVWIASDNPRINADTVRHSVIDNLDRDFMSIWRTTIADAPAAVATAAQRDLAAISFEVIAAADPVIAVKKTPESGRIRFASDAGRFLDKIYGTAGRIEEIRSRVAVEPELKTEPAKFKWVEQLVAHPGDAIGVKELWNDEETQALLVSRGMAETLTEPGAKIIVPPISGQVVEATEQYDKIYIVRIDTGVAPMNVQVSEFDTLMRHFCSLERADFATEAQTAEAIAIGLRRAFSPVVRIDDAGQKTASGLVRASGLALDKNSPAHLKVGDVLEPMVRKNDRNGNPLAIGPLDFAYLHVKEVEGRKVNMDFYAGRMGGLQGRKNNRTFRMGVRVRPKTDETTIRLHAKGKPNEPLIGYEIYDKELDSKSMTFVGRTDWSGRMQVGAIDRPLRLLYVKNGGAVLARLPVVPGHHGIAVADLAGDDMRLQAESYIRGVQNAVIDLVAIRELFKARIRLRLRKGEIEEAEELLEALRNEPTNEKLANDMGKKQAMFLKAIGRNPNQQRKVDEMFGTTRDLLSKHISPRLIRELEDDFITAKKNGGKLPSEEE